MSRPRRATGNKRGWNKRPVYNFPATVFVDRNTAGQQLDHVMSEADEVRANCLDESVPLDDIVHEMVDLTHSLETFWRIMEKHRGRSYVQGAFNEVEAKNDQRNYYATEGTADEVS